MIGLLDCNNFYVSCERLFNPKLLEKPVIILSNNDGCVISRSEEAKQIGVKMGEPFFKLKKFITDHNKYETKSPSYGIEREERIKLAKSITKKVFKKLSKEHRDVLRLRDQYELEYHEISEKLKIPIGTVMSRLFYARKRANHYAIKYKKELI